MVHTTTIKRLDANKTPSEIDMEVAENDGNIRIATGIYLLNEDVFKYCIALPGQPRPKAFAVQRGDGHTLVVMKRATTQESRARR